MREVLEEVEIGAAMVARGEGFRFAVTTVDSSVIVEADRQILAAAIANLVQNALKFTRPGTTVKLRGEHDDGPRAHRGRGRVRRPPTREGGGSASDRSCSEAAIEPAWASGWRFA